MMNWKRNLAGISLISILLASCGEQVAESVQPVEKTVGGAKLTLDKDTHDYGRIQKGGDGKCYFKVTNTGDQPLVISECKKSCGCTIPNCDKNPIAPGDTSQIEVTYDTQRVGPINKSVTVISNSKDEEIKVIRIVGEVVDSTATSAGNATPSASH